LESGRGWGDDGTAEPEIAMRLGHLDAGVGADDRNECFSSIG